jgi:hypothetical protein
MNFLLEKRQILELKLKLTTIQLDKQDSLRHQQYEKVADLRLEEKELYELLSMKKNKLIEFQNKLNKSQQSNKESNYINILIEEIKLQESLDKPLIDNSDVNTTNINAAFDRINQIKNDVLNENE